MAGAGNGRPVFAVRTSCPVAHLRVTSGLHDGLRLNVRVISIQYGFRPAYGIGGQLLSQHEIAPYTGEIRRLMGDANAAGYGSYGWVPYGFPNDPTKGVIYGVYHSNGSYFAEWRYYEGAQLKDVGRSKPFGAPVDALQELEEVMFIQPLLKYVRP